MWGIDMKPILDNSMFREATVDSGYLATMSSIVHKVAEKGIYRVIVFREEAKVGKFSLRVCDHTETSSANEKLSIQADIDLAALDNSAGAKGNDYPASFTLQTGDHVVFYVSTGTKEYTVEIFRLKKQKEPIKVFDSRLLGQGDLFITHMMRPGSYTIRNIKGENYAGLTVEFPEHEKLACNNDPVLIECIDRTMNPVEVKIQPVKALMFSFAQESRIIIELKIAEDRPHSALDPIITPAAVRKKEKTGETGEKTILRKIQFFG
jgi:hypothetical protein